MSYSSLKITLLLLVSLTSSYNVSLCSQFLFEGYQPYANQSTNDGTGIKLYGLCSQVQYYCKSEKKVLSASMIIINSNGSCSEYQQIQIQSIEANQPNKGFKVLYESNQMNQYICNTSVTVGCPSISSSLIWTFFENNTLTYTIICEIIGVILMIFGVYLFRITIILLGMVTTFIILIGIQSVVIFQPGIPSEFIINVLALTGICSFLVGYILVYFPKAGLFCLGSWIGLIISLTLNNIAFYHIISDPPNLTLWIFMPIITLAFGIANIFIRKSFTILATWAYLCLRALSWHLGAFPNQFLYSKKFQLGLQGKVAWQFYLYVIALIILTISSSALQYWLFMKKVNKTHGSTDLYQHFKNIEEKYEKQRNDLVEFEGVFKNGNKNPRKLNRKIFQENQDDSIEMESNNEVEIIKPQLQTKLVIKKKN